MITAMACRLARTPPPWSRLSITFLQRSRSPHTLQQPMYHVAHPFSDRTLPHLTPPVATRTAALFNAPSLSMPPARTRPVSLVAAGTPPRSSGGSQRSKSTYAQSSLPDLQVTPDFVTIEEEAKLVEQVETWMARKPYEGGHFDKVISNYRELQKPLRLFSENNKRVLERMRTLCFPPNLKLLPVHVLDLAEDGEIGPHVDHTDYSGRFIVSLSLLSDSTMTLRNEKSGDCVEFFLPQRSVYIMSDETRCKDVSNKTAIVVSAAADSQLRLRYDWAHSIPLQKKGRRISIIFRDAHANEQHPQSVI